MLPIKNHFVKCQKLCGLDIQPAIAPSLKQCSWKQLRADEEQEGRENDGITKINEWTSSLGT